MFWKNVQFKSLSLVTKLMLFYSFATIGLLSAISLFLYPTFIKLMEKIHGEEASLMTAECYEKIIIALLVGSLIAIFLGYVIARNGLRRMREFEDKMEKMTADSLHERINQNEWPKELKNLGIKFNSMMDRIQSSFTQLSRFSSDIAHELRTPINNLRGVTEVALTNHHYSDEYRQLLETYMSEYQYLSKLIDSLLFLARSEHGQHVLNKELLNMQTEISNICSFYQAMADENNIELTCKGDATLYADSTLFKRAISNLIANAIQYVDANGKITILIESIHQWVKITIQDTGIGIDHEHLPRIFDRFYRVDSSRSTQSGGLGLGLAIVKSIMDLHQGEIAVESKLNAGTTVSLRLRSYL